MTKEAAEDVNTVTYFLTFIGKEAYSLLGTLAMLEKPISLPYTTLNDLLDYVKYTNFERNKRRFCKVIHGDIKNSYTLRHPNPVHTQGYANNPLSSCDAVHENGHKFGQCLYCGRFHSFNSCKFRNSECFQCSDIGHIQSVCYTTVNLAATNIKSRNSDFIVVSVFPNDSLVSDETPCKSEEYMLNEPSHDRKHDAALIDADFSNDPLLCNDILSKFEEVENREWS
ncbi:unnamed protein product [Schistosoma curassoni]|uniref:CCHC-type domain-containing protein n=1 Tax=Schistosoma curassoni TaxID=6186 RepID=A0A183KKW7_9TREM|nr:unnamed protein product [Schistosoma curassoni]